MDIVVNVQNLLKINNVLWENMKKVNLIKMKTGQKGIIAHIDGGTNLEKRLAIMGVRMEKTITKLSAFVMKGPVAIKSGRTVIALGHGMASKIWINLIEK